MYGQLMVTNQAYIMSCCHFSACRRYLVGSGNILQMHCCCGTAHYDCDWFKEIQIAGAFFSPLISESELVLPDLSSLEESLMSETTGCVAWMLPPPPTTVLYSLLLQTFICSSTSPLIPASDPPHLFLWVKRSEPQNILTPPSNSLSI